MGARHQSGRNLFPEVGRQQADCSVVQEGREGAGKREADGVVVQLVHLRAAPQISEIRDALELGILHTADGVKNII